MRLKLGITTAALAALLAVGAVAGVALGSPARRAALGPIQAAVNKTSKAGSAKFSFSLTVKAKSLSSSAFTVTGTGAVDTKQQAATFTLNLGSLAGAIGAIGAAIPASVDGVVVDGVAYVHLPGIAATLGKGKEWLELDPKTLPSTSTGGIDLGQVKVDPQSLTKLLSSVSVHRIGAARVRGAAATKYRATVSVVKVVSVLPAKQRGATLKSLRKSGVKTVVIDVYVGRSGYISRVASALALNAGKQCGTSLAFTVDLYDYGTTVTAAAPPAAKTADAGPLLGPLVGSLACG